MERKRRVRAIWGLAGAVLAVAAIVVPLLVLAGSGQATLTAETYADVIRFGVQGAATLQIQIYDLSEKQLWDSGAISGDFVDWDRTDTWGERLANGYYLYRAQAWDASETLILDKTGKVALLPGDNVQLQAAPTPAPVSPLPDNPQSPQPKGQIGTLADTGIFGQVGIGTTGPQAPLDVAGNARFASTAPLNLFRETDQALPAGMWRLGVAGGSFLVDQNTAAAGNFSTYSRRLIISGGGNVGIGTSSPQALLDVAGNARFASTAPLNLFRETDQALPAGMWRLGVAGGGFLIDQNTAGAGNFSTYSRHFIISNGGNVGIGTTSPGQKLSVAGVIESTTGGVKFPDGTTQTTAASGGSGWSLTGNSGTTPGTNFLGTTNNVAFEIKVNGSRALRIEPDATSPNLIGGYSGNTVSGGVYGATISGGGASGLPNTVTDVYGAVGGGYSNRAGDAAGDTFSAYASTVGGGYSNIASGIMATVGGGQDNIASGDHATASGGSVSHASGDYATVSGGANNTASANSSTVGGGYNNTAGGYAATVSGGESNAASNAHATVSGGYSNTASGGVATVGGGEWCTAAGDWSFVAGRYARNGNAAHDGVFLFADSTYAWFDSAAANEFAVRASGGYRLYSNGSLTSGVTMAAGGNSWAAVSDRNAKANFAAVDTVKVLDVLDEMPVLTWNLQAQPDEVRHIGAMAQDFNASFAYLFGEVESPLHINMMDAVGITLAAAQGLHTLVQEQATRIEQLLAEDVQQAAEIEDLRARLEAVERLMQEPEARP